jgi:hypothetical protein
MSGRTVARTIGIWVFGLLASLIVGVVIGSYVGPGGGDAGIGAVYGGLAAMSAFACARLWLGPAKGER